MKILLSVIEFIARLLCRRKDVKKIVVDIPKDNYPMF